MTAELLMAPGSVAPTREQIAGWSFRAVARPAGA
jgi:hypothetical protein